MHTNFVNFIGTRSASKALFIGTLMFLVQNLCASFIILTYANRISIEFPPHLSVNLLAIIFGVCQFTGSIITTIFIEKLGRKVC